MGWIEDFVEHTKHGEAPPKVMYWVAVSTIAGALRRKVWIDEFIFQWTPNFYILVIGPPGVLKKSTSTNLGMRLLRRVEGIDFGPDSITWQQLITHMADARKVYKIGERDFEASCVTIELSEFGTLFDPSDRAMVDNMTELFDSKLKPFKKETKTSGFDEILNPWLNIIACASPGWMDDNFSDKFVRSGFASRVVYVHCGAKETGRTAHPSRKMKSKKTMQQQEEELYERLAEIAEYAGEYKLTEEAYQWSEKWYDKFRDFLENECNEDEMSLFSRRQAILMKLAMVISASKGKFPVIDVEELVEAETALNSVQGDIQQVFGNVGQSNSSKLAKNIIDVLVREGEQTKKVLYKKHFFRTVSIGQFNEALDSVKAGGLVKEFGNINDPLLRVV